MSNGFFPTSTERILDVLNVIIKCLHHGDVDHAVTGLLMLRQWIEEDYAIAELDHLKETDARHHIQ